MNFCFYCNNDGGYMKEYVDHDRCNGKLTETEGKCDCVCNEPLTKDEIFKIKKLIQVMGN